MARRNIFERYEYYKEILKPAVKDKPDREIKSMLCHCRYYKIGRLKKVSSEERVLYDFILKNNLNPKTLYENFVFIDYPENIKSLLRDKKIPLKEAASRAYSTRKLLNTTQGKELMEEVRKIIGGLKWQGLQRNLQIN